MSTTSSRFQQAIRKFHLWVGIAAGAFITMMGLSGLIIVFRPDFEAAAAPHPSAAGASACLSAMERSFAAGHPGARITRVTIPETSPGLLLVQADTKGKHRLPIYFDAASGREFGPKRSIAWLDWMTDLHQNLLMGKTGRALTGVIGAALLLMAISGIASWLAGTRDWRRGFSLPRKGPWRRTTYELHRWAGLWTNLLLLIISVTGVILAYPDSFEQAVRLVTREHTPRKIAAREPDRDAGQRSLPLDAYMHAALAAVPGGAVRELRMPARGIRVVSVVVAAPGDIRPKGESIVRLSRSSAAVVSVERSSQAPLSRRLVSLANAIHKTELGGLPVKVGWSLLGLVPAILLITGLQIWLSRRAASVRYTAASTGKHADPVAVPAVE
jgi:uncharacterized iron-regulated membrane protein